MELIHRAAVSECKPGNALTERDGARGQFLRILSNYVTCRRITFAVVVKINTTSIEWNDVAHLIDQNLERVGNVQRSSKRARDLVERIDLSMRFFDLVVSDEGTALARLGHINCAQLNRRFGRVVSGLMLKT